VRRDDGESLYQKKSLGQVFLRTEWPVQRMVERLCELRIARALEIGPGGGVLTRALLKAGLDVMAVEKDSRFAARMEEYASQLAGEASGRLEVINTDILKFDWREWIQVARAPVAVVGNIPYNISSPILIKGLEVLGDLQAMMFMTQLEFAQRVVARPSSKDYGSLSVYTQLRAEVSIEFKVERTCFNPVPKVDSAVILILPKRDKLSAELLKRVEQVTRTAFTQRRKKLRNSIRPFLEGKDEHACPLDLERRADSLSPQEYVQMTEWLFAA